MDGVEIERKIRKAVNDALYDTLVFYGNKYPEYRFQIFKEFEKQSIYLIRVTKRQLDEDDKIDE